MAGKSVLDSAAANQDGSTPNARDAAPAVTMTDAAGASAGSDGSSARDVAPGDEAGGTPETIKVLDNIRINSKAAQANFQKATSEFDLGPGPFERVTVVVDLDTSCYPFARWRDDPPPAGQNWPPKCDAFDRLFEIVLDPSSAVGAPPGVELIRAITPFGGPLHLEADVTDIINGMPGRHRLQAYIDTFSDPAGAVSGSDGGWSVSASMTVQRGKAPRQVLAVIPMYGDFLRTSAGGPIAFTVPPSTTRTRIEYRATGHTAAAGPMTGDCIGPPEEFCRRGHTINLDGQDAGTFVAWRTDCATLCTLTRDPPAPNPALMYCRENPTGAPASVRAPRANWCPGSITPAQIFEPTLAPGPHAFRFNVSTVDTGGKWRISAVLFAYGD